MSTPEAFYREVIDLNRYSNSVAGKYARAYNDIIIAASKKLIDIEFRQQGATSLIAPETRKRLRAIIKQSKDSLNTWSGESARAFKKELQGLAVLQTEFIENELKKVVASGNIPINSVAVSTGFGDAVVNTDPTRLNLFGRPEEEFKKFKAKDFALTTRRGELLTLPNGETVEKAFRGIAARQQESLARHIRQGVLSGETNVQIARRLMGRLNFNEYAKEGTRAFALAGNQPLKLANNQIKTIVRTSINQVSNAASQSVYAANKDVAPEYEYVATLDSRTSSICQRLDGQKFGYDKGPTPPQHFNCRSTTVPVVDYEGLGLTPPPETKITTRPSETGRVPQKVSYGDWLYEQRARGANDKLLKYEPGELQIKTLGFEKAKYFNRLAAKSNGKDALRQVIRSDGSELTLEQLKKKYGKPSDIKAAKKATPKVKATPKKEALSTTSVVMTTDGVESYLKTNNIAPDPQQFIEESLDNLEGLGGLIGANTKKMRQFMKKSKMINHFNMKGEKTNFDQVKRKFLSGNGLKAYNAQFKVVEKRFDVQLNKVDVKGKRATSKEYSEARFYWMQRKDVLKAAKGKEFDDIAKKHLFKNSGGMSNGFTSIDSNIIHTRIYENSKKIGSLQAKQIRKSAKETLDNNALLHTSDWDYMMKHNLKEVWSTSQPMSDEISWFSTMIHETGHQVHFQSGAEKLGRQWMKLKGLTFTTEYSRKNYLEQFAEAFTQYVLNPDGLKQHAPRLYNWVDASLEEALKSL